MESIKVNINMDMSHTLYQYYRHAVSRVISRARNFQSSGIIDYYKRCFTNIKKYQRIARHFRNNEIILVSRDKLMKFLEHHYRRDRFESVSGFHHDRSERICDTHMNSLMTRGESLISHHDSATGVEVKFYADLSIQLPERIEYYKNKGNLMHLF